MTSYTWFLLHVSLLERKNGIPPWPWPHTPHDTGVNTNILGLRGKMQYLLLQVQWYLCLPSHLPWKHHVFNNKAPYTLLSLAQIQQLPFMFFPSWIRRRTKIPTHLSAARFVCKNAWAPYYQNNFNMLKYSFGAICRLHNPNTLGICRMFAVCNTKGRDCLNAKENSLRGYWNHFPHQVKQPRKGTTTVRGTVKLLHQRK